MNEISYQIQKPVEGLAIKGLKVVLLAALVGLGLVAFEVFSLIDNPVVSVAFAVVIELGAMVEAINVLKRNKLAGVGLAVSLIISGFYNFTRANQANAGLAVKMGDVELVALAIGPLVATLTLSLALGQAQRDLEQAVAQWETNYQTWQDDQAKANDERLAAAEQRRTAREAELKQIEIDSAERIRLAELASAERSDKRKNRTERALARTATGQNRTTTGLDRTKPDGNRTAPESDRTYADFVRDQRVRNGQGPMTAADIMRTYGRSRTQAYTWLKKYRTETAPEPEPTDN